MGKVTDITLAVVILIVFIYAASRMGLTLGGIVSLFHTFIYGKSTSSTNSTGSFILWFRSRIAILMVLI